MSQAWWGIDLDKTMAVYDTFIGPEHIGAPIMCTIRRVRYWLRQGRDVRVFTARVHLPRFLDENFRQASQDALAAANAIDEFCLDHFGRRLPITCEKDSHMVLLLDDRAEQVIPNKGKLVRHELRIAVEALQKIASGSMNPYRPYLAAQEALSELDQWSLDLVKPTN